MDYAEHTNFLYNNFRHGLHRFHGLRCYFMTIIFLKAVKSV